MKTKIILVLVLIIMAVIILIQNHQVITFRIFFWRISMSQVILLPLALAVGFVIGYLLAKLGKGNKKNV
ncbi:LapA family protein [bacterium]|nr:MAG: LapA family protein [bacterium]